MKNSIVLITVLILWFTIYFFTLKRRSAVIDQFSPSKEMTNLLKGFACLVIAFHHFALRDNNINVETLPMESIAKLGGTFSLVIFLFLSGYGITLSEFKKGNTLKSFFKNRIFRVYTPLFLICFISFILYSVFNLNIIPEQVIEVYRLPESIATIGAGNNWIYNLLYIFGLVDLDWYVVATIIFYFLFFISFYYPFKVTSNNKVNFAVTISLLLIIYYIITYYFIGPTQGHYYRNTWAFFLGVQFALFSKFIFKYKLLLFFLIFTCIGFNYYIEGVLYALGALISFGFLSIMFYMDKYFRSQSRVLMYLGGISYFVYLSHIRLVYNSLWYFNNEKSIILFVLSFLIVSSGVKYIYDFINQLDKNTITPLLRKSKLR